MHSNCCTSRLGREVGFSITRCIATGMETRRVFKMAAPSRGFGAEGFLVAIDDGRFRTPTALKEASVFMHELGHNLGLHHGGDDGVNFSLTTFSIMNYSFRNSRHTQSQRT